MQVVHPFICDHEIYARGGQTILDGGRLYTDFIDVKPPLIYELFAFWIGIFGSSFVMVRLMDVCLQLAFIALLFHTLLKHTGSRFIAHGACLAFGAYVASLWMPVLLHPETLSFLPMLFLIRLGTKQTFATKQAIALGIIGGVLFSLKYPLVLPAILVGWALMRSAQNPLKMLATATAAFVGVVTIVFAVIWYDGFIDAMQPIVAFLRGYGSITGSATEMLVSGLTLVSDFLANDTSIFLTTCAITAIVAAMLGRHRRDALLSTTILALIGLTLSIVMERKFNHAHMPRLIPVLAILVGYGLPVIWLACRRAWKFRTFGTATLVGLAVIALVLSPLPRIWRTTTTFVQVAVLGKTWREATGIRNDGLLDLAEMETVIAVVRAKKPRSVVVLGLGGTLLYAYLPNVKKSKFADSHFFTPDYAPPIWNTEALEEARAADIIVMQNDDVHPRLTGRPQSTQSVLMGRAEWRELFHSRTLLHDSGKWTVWEK